jgi:microcompartment protein CcmL/EutN
MVEFATIARGIHASDAMVKAAAVEVIATHPIDPGKYMTLVTGDVASVEAAVAAGVALAGPERVLQSFVLANLHDQVIPALRGQAPHRDRDAVGVVETRTVAAIVQAADAACKASAVDLLKLRLAFHLGGKGYAIVVGDVADVEAAVEAAAAAAGTALVETIVIPNPYREIYERLLADDYASERQTCGNKP